jgi:hypothetical protein
MAPFFFLPPLFSFFSSSEDESLTTPSRTDPSDELRPTAPYDGNEEDVDVGANDSTRVGEIVDGCSVKVDANVGTDVETEVDVESGNEEGAEEGTADGFEETGDEEDVLESTEEGAADGFEDGTSDGIFVRDNDGSSEHSLIESSTLGSSQTVSRIQS